MTTACGDWNRGLALARTAWQSRRQTEASPPAVASCHFERDGVVIVRQPEDSVKKSPPHELQPKPEPLVSEDDLKKLPWAFAWTWAVGPAAAINPHEVVALGQKATRPEYQRLRVTIQKCGVTGEWNGRRYRYWHNDGFKYWHIYPVINRTREVDELGYYAEHIKQAQVRFEALQKTNPERAAKIIAEAEQRAAFAEAVARRAPKVE